MGLRSIFTCIDHPFMTSHRQSPRRREMKCFKMPNMAEGGREGVQSWNLERQRKVKRLIRGGGYWLTIQVGNKVGLT